MEVCLIRLTEIGGNPLWLNTWMIKSWSRLICATITNPFVTQFLKGLCSIHVSLYLKGWHLEEDVLDEFIGFLSAVLSEDVEKTSVAIVEVFGVAEKHFTL